VRQLSDRPQLPARLEEFLSTLHSLGERELQLQLLIETAERFKAIPPHIAKRPFAKDHLVPGCESEAYIWAEALPDKTFKFYFAVENPQGISAKSFAAILDETLSGLTAPEILAVPQEIVFQIFGRDLSMGKGQGLMGMLGMVKSLVSHCT
jgi:cysteine desulfuration protein SufE